jgi:hypothetical protein
VSAFVPPYNERSEAARFLARHIGARDITPPEERLDPETAAAALLHGLIAQGWNQPTTTEGTPMNNRPERRAQLAEKTTADLIDYALDLEDRLAAIDEGLGRAVAQLRDQAEAAERALAETAVSTMVETSAPQPRGFFARYFARR